MSRVGADNARLGVVQDKLDDVRAERLVERRDDERVGAARLVDVLPLGAIGRPQRDFPLVLLLVGEERLAETLQARPDAGAVRVDRLVRLPRQFLAPVVGDGVPRAVTEALVLGVQLEAEVEALVDGGRERAAVPLGESRVDIDGRAAGLLAAGDGLRVGCSAGQAVSERAGGEEGAEGRTMAWGFLGLWLRGRGTGNGFSTAMVRG